MFNTAPAKTRIIQQPANEWKPHSIADFSSGLNTFEPSASLRDNQFSAMLNWYIQPNGSLIVRGPYRPWLVASEDTIIVDTNDAKKPPLTFIIVELRGVDYRVASFDNGTNTEVSVYDETNNRWAGETAGGTSIKTGLDNSFKVRFVKYSINEAEDLIFCNGKDTPQRWVGTIDTASSDLGLAAPSDTTTLATSNSAVTNEQGIDLDGVYNYKFTAFYDDSGTSTKFGESGPTASDNITVAGADISANTRVQASLTNCPAIPSGATKNNVYRSPPEEINGPYRFVGYYSSGTAFVDKTPTGETGVEIPIDAGTPPKLKNPLSYDSRIWGIGVNSSGQLTNKGVWSRRGNPDYFDALNLVYFPDALIGPVLFNKLIYWFTEKQVYVTTDLDKPETSTVKVSDIGCDSFDSIVDVGNGLVWQFDGNVYWANFNSFNPVTGELPWPIGDPIKNKINDIPTARRSNSTGVLYKDRYYLSYTGTSQTVNKATICWDVKHGTRLLTQYKYGAWSSVDFSANDMQTFDGTLYTLDNTNKYIMEHDFSGVADFRSKTDFDASTSYSLNTQLNTGIIHFGHEWAQKLVNSLSIVAKSTAITLNTTVSLDGGDFERTKSFTLGSGTFASDSTWLFWGQGTWGNFNWASKSFNFQSDHKKFGKGGKCRNAKLILESTDSQDTNLIALKLYFKLLPVPA